MPTQFLEKIDWQRPWLEQFRSIAAPVFQADLQAENWRMALNTAADTDDLRNHRGLPIHFVPQTDLPAGLAYEAFISATGGVPTRDNLHDFFNAIVWLTYPKIKSRLNALQAAEIAKSDAQMRGRLRDATTIFDENAAILLTSDMALVAALREHRWRDLFVTQQAAFGSTCEVRLFGHALMEKLVTPYKAITAHAWLVPVEPAYFLLSPHDRQLWIDTEVAEQLAHGLLTSDFMPLPIMGLPGWCEKQDDAFYNDVAVFRPKRSVQN